MATKKHRTVYFNVDDPNDAALDNYVEKLGVKFSGYVKALIFQDQLSRSSSNPVNPYQMSQPLAAFDMAKKPAPTSYTPPTPVPSPVTESFTDDNNGNEQDELLPTMKNGSDVDELDTPVDNSGEEEKSDEVITGQDEQIQNFLKANRRRRREK